MKSRLLKPGFFTNEDLAECEPLARILYAGLWCFADKNGCFEWRPLKIKAEILPYEDNGVENLLEQLLNQNLIQMYQFNGKTYGFIPTFLNHQSPHKNEAKTSIPIPEHLSEKLHEINIPNININKNKNKNISYTEEFKNFWNEYPRKQQKGKAFEAWLKIRNPIPDIQEVLTTLEKYKKTNQWQDTQFIPLPATWINGRCWEDEPSERAGKRQRWDFNTCRGCGFTASTVRVGKECPKCGNVV